MVSNIKFVSFKELELRKRKPFVLLPALIFLMVLIVLEPEIFLFGMALAYVLHGPIRTLILWRRKVVASRSRVPAGPAPEKAGGGADPSGTVRHEKE